ncbi:MAG: hypothetical protein M1426_04725 [Patescibacteria group bacterium]|nr:hypothetical protein [Patescibacteria group bacterium]
MEERQKSYNLWASKDFLRSEQDDPREVAARAAVKDARRPERLFMPGGYRSVEMRAGEQYRVR